eukprot:CAMPEP_0117656060 /NCGR_PEP_ID=MMETSP0804-20121206/4606_1 /TAXON_ID=1074897 /ORGANISM="Tetraselmis astigmatica, Strain CCMP880" /LENGTH=86 /DNA_ID=CAMNT_0005462443 /DNA_START=187 /DNA_END=447 /DNA_ORIENTATION=+
MSQQQCCVSEHTIAMLHSSASPRLPKGLHHRKPGSQSVTAPGCSTSSWSLHHVLQASIGVAPPWQGTVKPFCSVTGIHSAQQQVEP